mmetsp:Transcript_15209/g.21351  ORF Transcript_15209/g.21351 Transcript_15209/m.21351 type:complete len:264 (-) Transcript_15209:186-977(-)
MPVEGFGLEVIYAAVATLTLIVISAIFSCLPLSSFRRPLIASQERKYVEDFRRERKERDGKEDMEVKLEASEDDGADHERERARGPCAICLEDVPRRPVETNCGHTFCSVCITRYWEHRSGQIRCPCCRTMISLLLACGPGDDGSDEMNQYNRMYSGQPLSLLEHLYDMPTLLRHLWNRILDGRGFLWLLRGHQLLVWAGMLLYLLSPFDMIPESVFGVIGFIDDLLVVGITLAILAVCFRQALIATAEAAGRRFEEVEANES